MNINNPFHADCIPFSQCQFIIIIEYGDRRYQPISENEAYYSLLPCDQLGARNMSCPQLQNDLVAINKRVINLILLPFNIMLV